MAGGNVNKDLPVIVATVTAGGFTGAVLAPQANWLVVAETVIFVIAVFTCGWSINRKPVYEVQLAVTMLGIACGSISALCATLGMPVAFGAMVPLGLCAVVYALAYCARDTS
jgi:hypothetical protein